jgi:formamidopyrimidine-DNA glycosylase
MPELSDVEGFRRYFARFAAGRRVESVAVADPMLARNTSPQGLGRALAGRRFAAPDRHGKWLIAPADGKQVLMHFGMTGLLVWGGSEAEPHPHDRIVFRLDGGELRYRNQRRFGGIWLARASRERDAITGRLGPDALKIDRDQFREILARRRGALKPALMDQKLIAGLGNLLSDEILWRARINPRTPVASLPTRRISRLHDAMRKVLRDSNRRGRVPPERGWLTGARNDRDGRCPRCGAKLARATIAGRTAVWCPRCQRSQRQLDCTARGGRGPHVEAFRKSTGPICLGATCALVCPSRTCTGG